MRPGLNDLQAYLAQEFVDDYLAGRMTRRDLIRRILGITGGIAATATLLLGMGCQPGAVPPPAGPPAQPQPVGASPLPTAPPQPAPEARSKLSVKPDDPAIQAAEVTFPGDGATLVGYLAKPK